MPPADSTSTPPTSTNGNGNLGKWVVLGCGGCLGLMVLMAIALTALINRTLKFAVGPDQVDTDNQDLFTYALPGESQGIFAMDMFGMQVTQVASTDSPPSVLLTMGKLPRYLQDRETREAFIKEFQNSVTVEGNYQLAEQRVEERTLCDQPVSVMLQSGRFEVATEDTTGSTPGDSAEGAKAYDAASLLTFVEYNNSARFVWVLAHGDTPQATADQVFATLDCR